MKKLSIIVPLGENRSFELKESLKDLEKDVELIVEVGPNPSANRNRGVKKAKGELVAFLNGHTIISDGWIKKVLKFFKEYPHIDVVGGPQLNYPAASFFEKASGYAMSSIFAMANLTGRYRARRLKLNASETDVTSANLICKRDVLEKVKFNESLWPGEDPTFVLDAKKEGFKVAYSPEIFVYHKRRDNFRDLFEQIMNYGYRRSKNLGRTILKNPLFLVPSAFLLYLLFLPILLLINNIFVIPLMAYLILTLMFSIFQVIKNKDHASIVIIPFIFFIIHISYGYGIIRGLFR